MYLRIDIRLLRLAEFLDNLFVQPSVNILQRYSSTLKIPPWAANLQGHTLSYITIDDTFNDKNALSSSDWKALISGMGGLYTWRFWTPNHLKGETILQTEAWLYFGETSMACLTSFCHFDMCVCVCGNRTGKDRSSFALTQADMYYLMCHPKTNSECLNPA